MQTIERHLRRLLPPLGSQKFPRSIVFHAKLTSDDSEWVCYLAEGSEVDGHFVVRGWFLGAIDSWQVRPLEEVLDELHQDKVDVHFDDQFSPIRYEELKNEMRTLA